VQYHPDDFLALSFAVEAEGGKLLAEGCEGHEFRLKVPDPNAAMKKKWKTYRSCHCDLNALMEIPYNPLEDVKLYEEKDGKEVVVAESKADKGNGMAKVCAVDDAVGLWPRYNKVVSKRSYQS
jgi:hypothetical protein